MTVSPLECFRARLQGPDLVARLRRGLIGEGAMIDGPFGPKPLIYADYVASGRALTLVEDFIRDEVLPYYANSHTEASYCGAFCTRLREAARAEIARMVGASDAYRVIFTGSGATAGINRIASVFGVAETVRRGGRAVVCVGPYEHHSNLLPWRESGAQVEEIPEAADGGPCLDALERALLAAKGADVLVGAFSAVSNVTGIVADTDAVTRLLKRHGALAVWDYAGGAPYVAIDMHAGTDCEKDAVVFSAHKFIGGPGASGLTVLRKAAARRAVPTFPGGGTVSFVSPWAHVYSRDIAHREEGGTPNVLGDIRAALVMLVKEALGASWLDRRHGELRQAALTAWRQNPSLEILGNLDAPALPIFSFCVRDGSGGFIHPQFITRLLSDLHGIQARGGCACAGSYAHRLLGIDKEGSTALQAALRAGRETEKPGWVRLNLSALNTPQKTAYIIKSVNEIAEHAKILRCRYDVDEQTARFSPRPGALVRQWAQVERASV